MTGHGDDWVQFSQRTGVIFGGINIPYFKKTWNHGAKWGLFGITCGLQKFHPGPFLASAAQKAACRQRDFMLAAGGKH